MPYQHGKFGPASKGSMGGGKAGAVHSTGSKAPPAKEPQAPHGQMQAGGEKHVTETMPGKTQPHPTTGVHAFHANHVGGGKYESHTHHDGGQVETKHHESAGDMHQAMNEALPDDQQGQGQEQGMPMDDMASQLGGIGGGDMVGGE